MGGCASTKNKAVLQTKPRRRIRRRETLNTSSIANKIFEPKSQDTELSSQQSLEEEWLNPQQQVELSEGPLEQHLLIEKVLGHSCY